MRNLRRNEIKDTERKKKRDFITFNICYIKTESRYKLSPLKVFFIFYLQIKLFLKFVVDEFLFPCELTVTYSPASVSGTGEYSRVLHF